MYQAHRGVVLGRASAEEPTRVELFGAIADADPSTFSDDHLVELVRATGRLTAHVEALQLRALAELGRRPRYARCSGTPDGRHEHDSARAAADEVSAAMNWTSRYADGKVCEALHLVEALPATVDALATGRIDGYRARVIGDETLPLADDPEALAEVEARVLARAEKQTGPQVRAHAKKAVIAAAPEAAEQRRRQSTQSRRVDKPVECGNGMAHMGITGPMEGLAAFWLAVDAAARARRTAAARAAKADSVDAGDDAADLIARQDVGKTLEQLRFDALADLGWSALQAQHLGCCNPACGERAQRLGTRHGTAAHIHVTVPFTSLIGVDDLPAELRGFRPLHRRHHNSKTLHGWRLQQHQPGHYLWISPTGHLYEVEPEAIGVVLEFDHFRHRAPAAAAPGVDPPPF